MAFVHSMEDIMRLALTMVIVSLLTSGLWASDTLSLNFDHFKSNKTLIPMLSLSVKPKQLNKIELIFSYVSNAFELKKSFANSNQGTYKYTQIACNLRF